MATTRIYPSAEFPAVPDGTPLIQFQDLLERVAAGMTPPELANAVTLNADKLRVDYINRPPIKRAAQTVKSRLAAATVTGLTPAEVIALLDVLNSATD